MKLALLLALLSVSECGSTQVVGRPGQNITLDCRYGFKKHGELSICWNRGEIPTRGCNNQLIATGDYKVNEDTSGPSRYRLLGRLDQGDASLTILNLTEEDAGRYGCRVDIYGWFNDEKHYTELKIEPDPVTTTSPEVTTETTTQQTSASRTPGQMTSTENVSTSSYGSDSVEAHESSTLTVVLVFILFGLIVLITAGGVFVMVRRSRQITKTPQVSTTVQFNSTSSTLQLQSRGSTVENVYQIDGATSGSDYELCP